MEALGGAASVIAVVELSAKVVSLCSQYYRGVRNAKDDITRLLQEINNLKNILEDVTKLLDGPNGTRLESSQKLKFAIEHSREELQKIMQKLDPGVGRKAMNRVGIRALKWPFSSEDVGKAVQDLTRCTNSISLALQIDQTTIVLNFDLRTMLDRLPVAEGASFDSRAEEHNPTCLPNTRVELLEKISKWVDDRSGKAIFWLNGMAGTGKSTISRTFACSQSRLGRLGASFFFKRGELDRGNLSKFMTTVARQLVKREPSLAPVIKEVLEADSNLPRSAVQEQFSRLIFGPLSRIARTAPIVVIIDALDECDKEQDIRLLINLFSRAQSLQSCRLRVFVTSRPELPIRLGFKDIKSAYQDLILHEMPSPMIEHDISAFLENGLRAIRDDYNASVEDEWKLPLEWPAQSDIKALVDMAIPLFIFAATACRFIAERRCGNPDMQLKKVLEYKGTSASSRLEATYMPILDQQIVDLSLQDRDEVIQQFQHIVGTIIVLASPLSISALTQLLRVPQADIKVRLDQLHSVLNIPTQLESPVRLLHLSFRDFLVNPIHRDTTPLWIDEKQMHRQIFEECLRIMGERLRSDMCDIQAPGTLRSDISHQRIQGCLSPELQYCCLYWVYHLQQTGVQASNSKGIYNFLTNHLLHWLEALSLIGRVSESLSHIKTLESLFKPLQSEELLNFLGDAVRFILANLSAIDSKPLQLYSLLTFLPKRSKVRVSFKSAMPRWLSLKTDMPSDWSQYQQTLEGHSAWVTSVAFSHDSALLASASWDRTVRVWRTDTGECQQTLEGHSDPVTSVAFSHDSALLASASDDNTVRVWRTDTGECIQDIIIRTTTVRLSFQPGDLELLTDVGALAIHGMKPTSSAKHPTPETSNYHSGYGISIDRCWITWNGDNLLWLPAEFRPSCSAISISTVVIGCSSGRVMIVRFFSDKMPGVSRHV